MLYGECGEMLEEAGGRVAFCFVCLDAFEHLAQAVQGVGALPWNGGVRTGAFDVYLHLQPPLFTDAKDIGEPAAAGVYGVAPAFIDGEGCRQLVCVVVGQPAKAVASAVLFIRAGG